MAAKIPEITSKEIIVAYILNRNPFTAAYTKDRMALFKELSEVGMNPTFSMTPLMPYIGGLHSRGKSLVTATDKIALGSLIYKTKAWNDIQLLVELEQFATKVFEQTEYSWKLVYMLMEVTCHVSGEAAKCMEWSKVALITKWCHRTFAAPVFSRNSVENWVLSQGGWKLLLSESPASLMSPKSPPAPQPLNTHISPDPNIPCKPQVPAPDTRTRRPPITNLPNKPSMSGPRADFIAHSSHTTNRNTLQGEAAPTSSWQPQDTGTSRPICPTSSKPTSNHEYDYYTEYSEKPASILKTSSITSGNSGFQESKKNIPFGSPNEQHLPINKKYSDSDTITMHPRAALNQRTGKACSDEDNTQSLYITSYNDSSAQEVSSITSMDTNQTTSHVNEPITSMDTNQTTSHVNEPTKEEVVTKEKQQTKHDGNAKKTKVSRRTRSKTINQTDNFPPWKQVYSSKVCFVCKTPMLNYINGSAVNVQCKACESFWCLLDNCSYQADNALLVAHQQNDHSENRNLTDFNAGSNLKCNCDASLCQSVYTNSNTLGQCRSCHQAWCLVPGCNRTYDDLLNCVNHQHSTHTLAERDRSTGAAATICGGCGMTRNFRNQYPASKNEMCPNCFTVWCMHANCTREFDSYKKWANHNSRHQTSTA